MLPEQFENGRILQADVQALLQRVEVPYDSSVFGHLVPRQMQLASNPDPAQARLREVVMRMSPTARRLILDGLVRPNAILIGSYSAPGHRCCPLASAVWEATGSEATSFDALMAGIAELGFEPDHQQFTAAFDSWASCYGTTTPTAWRAC